MFALIYLEASRNRERAFFVFCAGVLNLTVGLGGVGIEVVYVSAAPSLPASFRLALSGDRTSFSRIDTG
jgi:hypothetical protein